MDIQQVRSLRKQVLDAKARKWHWQLQVDGWWFREQYEKGEELWRLAQSEDYPPMAVFRAVLSARGLSKGAIKRILKEESPAELTERDIATMKECEARDIVANVNQVARQQAAQDFEDKVCAAFASHGIPFTREDELYAKQVAQSGQASATPDLLFKTAVTVDGSPVAWVDAKGYYGSDLPHLVIGMQQQVDRYRSRWGPGALVFELGFVEGLQASLHGAAAISAAQLRHCGCTVVCRSASCAI